MKLPCDIGGVELAKALGGIGYWLLVIGYRVSRQTGSHLRLTYAGPPEHHMTIPAHKPLKLGTLAGILADVALYQGLNRDELLTRLF